RVERVDDQNFVVDDRAPDGQGLSEPEISELAADLSVGERGRTYHRDAALLEHMRRGGRDLRARFGLSARLEAPHCLRVGDRANHVERGVLEPEIDRLGYD